MQSLPEKPSYGQLLRFYREKSVERRARKRLSQSRLAMKLSEKTGLMFNRNSVSNWENDKTSIPAGERKTLIAIIAILFEHEGLATLEAANRLLEAGNYRALNEEEREQIARKWNLDIPPNSVNTNFKNHPPEVEKQPDKTLHSKRAGTIELYSAECGETPINLGQQRLLVSVSFGSYFAGLLEKPRIYLDLESQIDCPVPRGQEGLPPLQQIFWLLAYAKGPRTMIISGEGGMGKSTLSAKMIRCLYQEQAIDMILGDSARSEHVHPATGEILRYQPGYYDPQSFYQRVCNQLGLPGLDKRQAINAIKDRLVGRKAIIVVDNLETVEKGNEILDALRAITSRDVRAIVTTRKTTGIKALANDLFVVQLRPLINPQVASKFLLWHIEEYQYQHPTLQELRKDVERHVGWLIDRTGGIPLLMQLVLSDAARYSWDYVQTLPHLFGKALLDFLYRTRWDELGSQGQEGEVARLLLKWMAREQYHTQSITSKEIYDWARNNHIEKYLSTALSILFEMFLIINRDPVKGNFTIYPSLREFLTNQQL